MRAPATSGRDPQTLPSLPLSLHLGAEEGRHGLHARLVHLGQRFLSGRHLLGRLKGGGGGGEGGKSIGQCSSLVQTAGGFIAHQKLASKLSKVEVFIKRCPLTPGVFCGPGRRIRSGGRVTTALPSPPEVTLKIQQQLSLQSLELKALGEVELTLRAKSELLNLLKSSPASTASVSLRFCSEERKMKLSQLIN